ncbi:phage neck terminator protein [Paenibacillus sp. strain BS8-2]
MIQFESIRSAIVRGMSAALGVRVIEINGMGPMPPYPFLTYDFADPSGQVVGHMARTVVGDQLVLSGLSLLDLSFNSYARDKAGGIQLAEQARDWLLSDGHWHIKDNSGAVVVTVGAVSNRDIQLGDEWERRHGFDVELRAANVITTPFIPINKATIREVD